MLLARFSAALLLTLIGCTAAPASSADGAFRERLLATIAGDARVVVPVAFSRDGRRAAYVEQRDDVRRVVCGETKGKPFGVLC